MWILEGDEEGNILTPKEDEEKVEQTKKLVRRRQIVSRVNKKVERRDKGLQIDEEVINEKWRSLYLK